MWSLHEAPANVAVRLRVSSKPLCLPQHLLKVGLPLFAVSFDVLFRPTNEPVPRFLSQRVQPLIGWIKAALDLIAPQTSSNDIQKGVRPARRFGHKMVIREKIPSLEHSPVESTVNAAIAIPHMCVPSDPAAPITPHVIYSRELRSCFQLCECSRVVRPNRLPGRAPGRDPTGDPGSWDPLGRSRFLLENAHAAGRTCLCPGPPWTDAPVGP